MLSRIRPANFILRTPPQSDGVEKHLRVYPSPIPCVRRGCRPCSSDSCMGRMTRAPFLSSYFIRSGCRKATRCSQMGSSSLGIGVATV